MLQTRRCMRTKIANVDSDFMLRNPTVGVKIGVVFID